MQPRPRLCPRICLGKLALAIIASSLCAAAYSDAAPENAPAPVANDQTHYAAFLREKLSPLDDGARAAFIYPWVDSLNPAQYAPVFAQSQSLPAPLRDCVREALLLKWAQEYPGAAWAALRAEPSLDSAAAAAFMGAWAELNFAAAWSAANAEGAPELPASVLTPLMVCHARTQPQDAAQRALNAADKNLKKTARAVFQVWGQSDPNAAVAFAVRNSCIQQLDEMYADWLARDFDAAVAALNAMPQDHREALIEKLFGGRYFTRGYPEAALKLNDLILAKNGGRYQGKYLLVSPGWLVNMMPEETFRRCAAIPDKAQRQYALDQAVCTLAASDANAAFDAFLAFQDTLYRPKKEDRIYDVMPRLAKTAPLRTIAFIETLPDKAPTSLWMTTALDALEPQEIPQALTLLDKMADRDAIAAVARRSPEAFRAWIATIKNPATAKHLAQLAGSVNESPATVDTSTPQKISIETSSSSKSATIPSIEGSFTYLKSGELKQTITDGNVSDIIDALRALTKLPSDDPRRANAALLLGKLSERDRAVFVDVLSDPAVFDLTCRNSAYWTNTEIEEAFARRPDCIAPLAARLDAERARTFLPTACRALARSNPQAALELAKTMPAGDEQDALILSVNEIWARSQPEAALRSLWAKPLGSTAAKADMQKLHCQQNMRRWAEIDPDAASAWLLQLPHDARKDALIAAFVETQTKYNTPEAFQWAMRIREPNDRLRNAQAVIAAWKTFDPGAAAAEEETLKPLIESLREANRARPGGNRYVITEGGPL